MFSDRENIQQSLSGMFMWPITSIYDSTINVLRKHVWSTWRMMSYDHNIHVHCFDRLGGIDKCFALAEATGSR